MKLKVMILAALLLAPAPAAAWWEYGHYTVGRIAQMSAKPSTVRAVRQLIARSAELETPKCPIRNIEDAAYWPDCVRQMGERFNYSFPWHYQNVDICKPFDPAGACRDGNCVSAQIERNTKLLADKSLPVRERVMALAFLAHFVGDLHMPLTQATKAIAAATISRPPTASLPVVRTSIRSGTAISPSARSPPHGPMPQAS